MSTGPRDGHRSPNPPADPSSSPLVHLARAFVDVQGAHPAAKLTVWHFWAAMDDTLDYAALADEERWAMAVFRSAMEALNARAEGTIGVGAELRRLAPTAQDDTVTALAQGANHITGWLDDAAEWHLGLAGLSQREEQAFQLWASGHRPVQIAQLMDRKRTRRDAQLGAPSSLTVEAAEKLVQRARHKLAECLEEVDGA